MVKREGVRSQETGVRRQQLGARSRKVFLILASVFCLLTPAFGQQPQAQPIYNVNSKAVQGVGPATWTYGAAVNIYANASTGNDSTGNGSSGAPYQTIGRAIQDVPKFVAQNYVIHLAAGTYYGQVNLTGRTFMTDLSGSLANAAITLLGDITAPDNYVISGATAGAPTTASSPYTVVASASNVILEGVSLQYATTAGLMARRSNVVIYNSTFRNFINATTLSDVAVWGRQFSILDVRGDNTISNANVGFFVDTGTHATSFSAANNELFNTGFPVSGTLTITGITGSGGMALGALENGFFDVPGTVNITCAAGATGNYGIWAWERAWVVLTTGSITGCPTGIYGNASSSIYLDSGSISSATTGVELHNQSVADWFNSVPTFTSVTTQYTIDTHSVVVAPTQTLSDGSLTSTGAINLTAGGTNQNVTLTPSGTGYTILNGNVGLATTTPESLLQAGPMVAGVYGSTSILGQIESYRANPPAYGSAIAGRVTVNSGSTGPVAAVYGEANDLSTSSLGEIHGGDFEAYHSGSGALSYAIGLVTYVEQTSGSGVIANAQGINVFPNAVSAGTITNNYGIYLGAQTAGTNNYQIYSAGTAPSFFAGSFSSGRAINSGLNTVTFSATPTFDASLGNTQTITLTGNVTSSTLSNAAAGEKLNFVVCQDATGSRTFVWPTQMHGAMTIGATASKCSAQSFIFDGTNAYALGPGIVNQ